MTDSGLNSILLPHDLPLYVTPNEPLMSNASIFCTPKYQKVVQKVHIINCEVNVM